MTGLPTGARPVLLCRQSRGALLRPHSGPGLLRPFTATVARVPQPWWLQQFCQGDPNGLSHHQPPFTALQEGQAFVWFPLGSVWLSPRTPEPRWPEGGCHVSGQTPACPWYLIPGSSTAPPRCPWPGLEDPRRELLSFPWPRASRQVLPRRPPATHGAEGQGGAGALPGCPHILGQHHEATVGSSYSNNRRTQTPATRGHG